jgi:hypothetical protein
MRLIVTNFTYISGVLTPGPMGSLCSFDHWSPPSTFSITFSSFRILYIGWSCFRASGSHSKSTELSSEFLCWSNDSQHDRRKAAQNSVLISVAAKRRKAISEIMGNRKCKYSQCKRFLKLQESRQGIQCDATIGNSQVPCSRTPTVYKASDLTAKSTTRH